VGVFSSTDPDSGDTFTYSLAGGAGGNDNGSFSIDSGGTLLTAASFDFESKPSYSIRVRSTDSGGQWFEKQFTINVTDVDESPPTVTNVLVRGTAWASGFPYYNGYAVPGGAAQLTALPWTNINQVKIVFSEDVLIDAADVVVRGGNTAQYAGTLSYDQPSRTATWTAAASLPHDKFLLVISGGAGGVTDLAGNRLDGEWTDGVSGFPSGNGTPGGDFRFRFNVLPGDANASGVVNSTDVAKVRSVGLVVTDATNYRCDLDGSGVINSTDVAAVRGAGLRTLSSIAEPTLPAAPPEYPAAAPPEYESQAALAASPQYAYAAPLDSSGEGGLAGEPQRHKGHDGAGGEGSLQSLPSPVHGGHHEVVGAGGEGGLRQVPRLLPDGLREWPTCFAAPPIIPASVPAWESPARVTPPANGAADRFFAALVEPGRAAAGVRPLTLVGASAVRNLAGGTASPAAHPAWPGDADDFFAKFGQDGKVGYNGDGAGVGVRAGRWWELL
jgi:hypothetical protein